MTQHQLEWGAIALMGLVTFATRIGGVWLAPLIPRNGFCKEVVDHLPSTLLVAIATPYFVAGDRVQVVAACATLLAAVAGTHLVISMSVGVSVIALLRALG